jgi:hypothetical protein
MLLVSALRTYALVNEVRVGSGALRGKVRRDGRRGGVDMVVAGERKGDGENQSALDRDEQNESDSFSGCRVRIENDGTM